MSLHNLILMPGFPLCLPFIIDSNRRTKSGCRSPNRAHRHGGALPPSYASPALGYSRILPTADSFLDGIPRAAEEEKQRIAAHHNCQFHNRHIGILTTLASVHCSGHPAVLKNIDPRETTRTLAAYPDALYRLSDILYS